MLHIQCSLQGNCVLDGLILYLAASVGTGTQVWVLCAMLCTITQQLPWESSADVIKQPRVWLCKVRCLLRSEKSLHDAVAVCLREGLYFIGRFVWKQLINHVLYSPCPSWSCTMGVKDYAMVLFVLISQRS